MELLSFLILPLLFIGFSLAVTSKSLKDCNILGLIECLLWWLTISLVMPFRAARYGFSKILAWIWTLVSPAALITYIIVMWLLPYSTIPTYIKAYKTITFNQDVSFPSYTIKNVEFHPVDISDYNENADIVFDEIPSDKFIEDLEKSDDWVKCEDGWYEYAGHDKEAEFSSFYLYIRINPKGKIGEYSYIDL